MTRNQWLFGLFWIIIGSLLAYQAYEYNARLEQAAADHPEQHAYPPDLSPHVVVAPPKNAPDVQQTAYGVTPDDGGQTFTAHATLTNKGLVKATDIRVFIRPYRGSTMGDPELDHRHAHRLTDDEPASQTGEWVSSRDLGPGESATVTYDFVGQTDLKPGVNPEPKITFSPAQSHP